MDHRGKIKENKKRDKYFDLAKELRKLWNMRVMVIPIVNGAVGMVPKSLEIGLEELKIRGHIETIQTAILLRLTKILRKVLEM